MRIDQAENRSRNSVRLQFSRYPQELVPDLHELAKALSRSNLKGFDFVIDRRPYRRYRHRSLQPGGLSERRADTIKHKPHRESNVINGSDLAPSVTARANQRTQRADRSEPISACRSSTWTNKTSSEVQLFRESAFRGPLSHGIVWLVSAPPFPAMANTPRL